MLGRGEQVLTKEIKLINKNKVSQLLTSEICWITGVKLGGKPKQSTVNLNVTTIPLVTLGSLRNHDDNGNKNVTNLHI